MSSFAPKSSAGDAAAVPDADGYLPGLTWKEGEEFFPGIGKIAYEGPSSLNSLAFKHYNPEEVIMVCWRITSFMSMSPLSTS